MSLAIAQLYDINRAVTNDEPDGLIRGCEAELFLYPGSEHSFADSSLPSYDPDATALPTTRALEFLQTDS